MARAAFYMNSRERNCTLVSSSQLELRGVAAWLNFASSILLWIQSIAKREYTCRQAIEGFHGNRSESSKGPPESANWLNLRASQLNCHYFWQTYFVLKNISSSSSFFQCAMAFSLNQILYFGHFDKLSLKRKRTILPSKHNA